MIDIMGAVAIGAYTRHKIKEDFKSGHGEESIKAATMVYGAGALRNGSQGIVSLGGLIGVKKGIDDIDRMQRNCNARYPSTDYPSVMPDDEILGKCSIAEEPKKDNIWREHCEDGSQYGINPEDFNSADAYEQALYDIKNADCISHQDQSETINGETKQSVTTKRYIWRKYCENGDKYGINPDDYETADEYYEAINRVKSQE